MSVSGIAVGREQETGAGEDAAAGAAGEAFAALASAARRIRALARAGGGLPAHLVDAELAGLAHATRAAEDLADAVAGRRIPVRAIADAAVAGAAPRRLRVAR